MSTDINEEPSPNDLRLIEEAIKRLRSPNETVTVDHETLFKALATEVRRGRRDISASLEPGTDF